MRSTKTVRIQSTTSYRIVRLISYCRFFSCIAQKLLQTDYFGAEFRYLIAGRLMATGYACVCVLSVILSPCQVSYNV